MTPATPSFLDLSNQDVLLYEFDSGHPAAEAHQNLSQVLGTEAPSERFVRACFQRFKAGNKKLEDEPRSGRPTAISFDELKNLAEQEHPYEGVRYFAASLGCSLSTVSNELRSFGMVNKLGQWFPHALNGGNRQRRPDICTYLLSISCRLDWLDTIVTGDGKWVLYVNHTHKRAWCAGDEMPDPFVKGEIHKKKNMLRVWWGVHGICRFELLPDNMLVTAEVYCAQLQRLADKIRKEHTKLDSVRLLHDNARPHIAKKTSQKILELGWEHHLEEKRYDDRDPLENDLWAFFASKSPEFYAKGIRDLVRRWQKSLTLKNALELTGGVKSPTKFAVRAVMECLQMELRDRGLEGIVCSTLCPYFARTPMVLTTGMRPTSTWFPFMSVDSCSRRMVDAVLKEKCISFMPNYVTFVAMMKGLLSFNTARSLREYLGINYGTNCDAELSNRRRVDQPANYFSTTYRCCGLFATNVLVLIFVEGLVMKVPNENFCMVYSVYCVLMFIHVIEGIYVLHLCDEMKFSFACSAKWFIQTLLVGYPSLHILVEYAQMRRKLK
ncbi:hypothetical protein RB195_023242 [Necator americanus]|uniref:Mos1 transposase HTH domain-containing protein n=1 Tax=Necator americanus TaxID=51031 RepID=A0ABR1EKZ3_NECAM